MRITAGTLKNQKIITPKGPQTRPSTEQFRKTVFDICRPYLADAQFLDLFAGSGAMGIEALSQGAAFATFVENHRDAIRCIKDNVNSLKLNDCTEVIPSDVSLALQKMIKQNKQFDVIFADPPYQKKIDDFLCSEMILLLIDQSALLVEGGLLLIEESSAVDVLTQNELKKLKCIKSRKIGDTTLHQYINLSH